MQGVSHRQVKWECVCTVLSSFSYVQFSLRAPAGGTALISGAKQARFWWASIRSRCLHMKMTTKAAMLAEVEEDIDSEDEEDSNSQGSDSDEGVSSSEICTFNVPYFRYIDDEDVEEGREQEITNGSNRYRSSCSSEKDRCPCSSHRYVVVSGTPLKILEHLLSDLRLDDQRGAPESRESGKLQLLYCDTAVIKASIGKKIKSWYVRENITAAKILSLLLKSSSHPPLIPSKEFNFKPSDKSQHSPAWTFCQSL